MTSPKSTDTKPILKVEENFKWKQNENHLKSLKCQLRNMQMNRCGFDEETSSKVKELLIHLDDNSTRCSNKSFKIAPAKVAATPSSTTNNSKRIVPSNDADVTRSEVLELLKEQKQMLENFQGDIKSLRSDITSQISDYGDNSSVVSSNSRVNYIKGPLSCCKNRQQILNTPSLKSKGSQNINVCNYVKCQKGSLVNAVNSRTSTPLNPSKNVRNYQAKAALQLLKKRDHLECMNLERENQSFVRKFETNFNDSNQIMAEERPPINRLCKRFPTEINTLDASQNTNSSEKVPAHHKMNVEKLGSNGIKDTSSLSVDLSAYTQCQALEKVEKWRQENQRYEKGFAESSFKIPRGKPFKSKRSLKSSLQSSYNPPRSIVTALELDITPIETDESVIKSKSSNTKSKGRYGSRYSAVNHEARRKEGRNVSGILLGRHKAPGKARSDKEQDQSVLQQSNYPGSPLSPTKSTDCRQTEVSLQGNNIAKCLGCHPSSRFPSMILTSKNTNQILQNDGATCPFHLNFLEKASSLLKKWLKNRMKQNVRNTGFKKSVKRKRREFSPDVSLRRSDKMYSPSRERGSEFSVSITLKHYLYTTFLYNYNHALGLNKIVFIQLLGYHLPQPLKSD